MGRLAWLKWRMRYGNPNTRLREMRFFLSFEIYNLLSILNAYRIRHWLRPKSLGPAGKYLRVVRPAPRFVRFLDQVFSFGEESHCDYLRCARGPSSDQGYAVELASPDRTEAVSVVLVERTVDEGPYVRITASASGVLFDRVLGRVTYALAAHSDNLMIHRMS